MAWHARSLRLTAFPAPGSDLNEAPNWQALMGQPPEETTSRAGQVLEKGPAGTGVLHLAKQVPLRTDLVLMDGPNAHLSDPSTLEAVPNQLAVLGPLAEAFLRSSPPLQRIAFGADLVHPRNSRDEAYRYLTEAIHGARLDLEGASDFLYQINRPRESQVLRGARLNRLAKWSASKWTHYLIAAGTGQLVGPEGFGSHLDLDINTPAERTDALPRDVLPDLFRELVSLGMELSERGDIR